MAKFTNSPIFCQTVLDGRYLNLLIKLGSNDLLNFLKCPFSENLTKYVEKWGFFLTVYFNILQPSCPTQKFPKKHTTITQQRRKVVPAMKKRNEPTERRKRQKVDKTFVIVFAAASFLLFFGEKWKNYTKKPWKLRKSKRMANPFWD